MGGNIGTGGVWGESFGVLDMMLQPLSTAGIGIGSGLLLAAGFFQAEIQFMPDTVLPIDLHSVAFNEATMSVRYDRAVNWDAPINSVWRARVVNSETERSVDQCDASGYADYGPGEPRVQTFDFAMFTTPLCYSSLESCVEYELVAEVAPTVGVGDQVRSQPFTVRCND